MAAIISPRMRNRTARIIPLVAQDLVLHLSHSGTPSVGLKDGRTNLPNPLGDAKLTGCHHSRSGKDGGSIFSNRGPAYGLNANYLRCQRNDVVESRSQPLWRKRSRGSGLHHCPRIFHPEVGTQFSTSKDQEVATTGLCNHAIGVILQDH